MEDLLNTLSEKINEVRVALDAVSAAQTEESDVSNDTHLSEAEIALDNFEMHVSSLVP